MSIKGKISSFQSLGAVDGPGIRFVAFFKGCPLSCVCCHNPETKDFDGGTEYSSEEIGKMAEKYKPYFGKNGGITLSGGEPLAQAEFAAEIFRVCHENGIHTCLDTSGCYLTDAVKELLSHTDLVLLDIKYTNNEDYLKYAGWQFDKVLTFLDYLEESGIKVWIRQVIIPKLNDTKENILKLKSIIDSYSCVEKTELLPFRKICQTKYDDLKIEFPLKDTPEPTKEKIIELKKLLSNRA